MDTAKDKTLSSLGEFGLIERLRQRFPAPEGLTGIGDDCAILPQQSGRDTLVSTDMLIEGTHFLRGDIPPYALGWKSAAVNISDIAAMGGRPTATFLSLALPADLGTAWVDEFFRGYTTLSKRFGAALLGGDTTGSPRGICINVAVLGECPGGTARKRSDAREGDLVCVSGNLGDSALGLRAILEGLERDADIQALIDRHYLPLPRVEEGLRLASTAGVHAMMDLSDGLASDLPHILEASGKGAEIDTAALPLSDTLKRVCTRLDWDPLPFALGGGEDYELLFTVDPDAEKDLDVPHTVIGKIIPCHSERTRRIHWHGTNRAFSGFDHFHRD